MFRNKQQNKRFHGLISEMGLDKKEMARFKKEMALKYSNGRTSETSKLLVNEFQAMINELGLRRPEQRKLEEKQKQEQDPANRMRRKILSICREMGGDWFKNGTYNWQHINGWLFKYGYLKKGLNDYTAAELPKLVTQFENMLLRPYAKG